MPLIAARSFFSRTATPTFAEARDLLNGSAAPKPFSLGNNSYTNVVFTADGCAEAFPKEPYGVLSIHQYLFAYYKGSPKWRAFYSVTYDEKAPRAEKLLYQRKKEASCLRLRGNRQRPILPGRGQPSTFGTGELNYCVRYGNRWDLSVITTGRVFDPF